MSEITAADIQRFNNMANEQLAPMLLACCHSQSWVTAMLQRRPFANESVLKSAATEIWFELKEADWLEGFAGHPQIGDLESLRKKFQTTAHLAGSEQGQVALAGEQTLRELSERNREYADKFGFIFIVCATGKSAEQMLAMLKARLPRTRAEELQEAARQQDQITHLRLEKLLCQH